jgi:hypothetical protein
VASAEVVAVAVAVPDVPVDAVLRLVERQLQSEPARFGLEYET